MLKVKPSQRGSYYYLHSYLLLLCTASICTNRWPKMQEDHCPAMARNCVSSILTRKPAECTYMATEFNHDTAAMVKT